MGMDYSCCRFCSCHWVTTSPTKRASGQQQMSCHTRTRTRTPYSTLLRLDGAPSVLEMQQEIDDARADGGGAESGSKCKNRTDF